MNMTYYMPELVAPGKRVQSYPDHLFNAKNGTIERVWGKRILVRYDDLGTVKLYRNTGRFDQSIDTSLDIQSIETD